MLDSQGIRISQELHDQRSPVIACDGGECLIVWEDARNHGASFFDIYGARIESGVVRDPLGLEIASDPASSGHPAVAWNALDYLVTWEYRVFPYGVHGTRVSRDGTTIDRHWLDISVEPVGQWSPVVAVGWQGRYLVAYTRLDPDRPYSRSTRVRSHVVTERQSPPFGRQVR